MLLYTTTRKWTYIVYIAFLIVRPPAANAVRIWSLVVAVCTLCSHTGSVFICWAIRLLPVDSTLASWFMKAWYLVALLYLLFIWTLYEIWASARYPLLHRPMGTIWLYTVSGLFCVFPRFDPITSMAYIFLETKTSCTLWGWRSASQDEN